MKKYGAKGQLSDPPQLGESVVVLAWEAEAAIAAAEQRGRETIDVSQIGKPGGSGNVAWDKGYEAGRRDERAELRDPGTAATRGAAAAEQRGRDEAMDMDPVLRRDAYLHGQRDMLAKCIETVEGALIPTEDMNSSWNQPIHVALEYLDYLKRGSND